MNDHLPGKINIAIVPANRNNLSALSILARETFIESFGHLNRKEDIEKYLAKNLTETSIASEFADEANKFFLAKMNDTLIGYIKLRPNENQDKPSGTKAIEIERIYVRKEHHDKKIGATLMEHAIGFAEKNGYETIWLGVWERNDRAIKFYERWGFKQYGSHPFILGNDSQTDILMKKVLK